MLVSKLLGERLKEAPKDCVIESHSQMIRGGYMKYVSNGSYSLFMPARRITRKIENIIREEMDRIDGQEVLMPVVMPVVRNRFWTAALHCGIIIQFSKHGTVKLA